MFMFLSPFRFDAFRDKDPDDASARPKLPSLSVKTPVPSYA